MGAGRTLAELAADAVGHDGRQDESHAGDADHMRTVLIERAAAVVMDRPEMHDDVRDAADDHQQQAEQDEQREPLKQTHEMYR